MRSQDCIASGAADIMNTKDKHKGARRLKTGPIRVHGKKDTQGRRVKWREQMGGWHIEKDARMNGPDGQPLAGMISIRCLYPSVLAKWLVWGKHLRRGEEVSSTRKSLTSNNIVFQRFIPGQPRLKKNLHVWKNGRNTSAAKKKGKSR